MGYGGGGYHYRVGGGYGGGYAMSTGGGCVRVVVLGIVFVLVFGGIIAGIVVAVTLGGGDCPYNTISCPQCTTHIVVFNCTTTGGGTIGNATNGTTQTLTTQESCAFSFVTYRACRIFVHDVVAF